MIYAIVAFDSKQGIATDKGIPWHIPDDLRHYRNLTLNHDILMGHNTYEEFLKPMQQRRNYVWCQPGTVLRDGFLPVYNAEQFIKGATDDVWVIGGEGLFAEIMHLINELRITRIEADFNCTKFFPPYEEDFELTHRSSPKVDNNLRFTYETWTRR